MDDWEYDMWWDSVNSLEEDYDDMDDWQGGRPINFSEIYKTNRSYESFFVRLSSEKSGTFYCKIFIEQYN